MVELGVSPRGAQAFLRAAQARAFLQGRSFVLPDDVKTVAIPCMGHRLMMRGGVEGREASEAARAVVEELVETEPVPR